MSARSAANVWIVVWMFGISFGSGGCVAFVAATGIVVNLRVMVFTVTEAKKDVVDCRASTWTMISVVKLSTVQSVGN